MALKFSSVQELPAGKTTLTLRAQPGSLCSVRAIDRSVLLQQAEQELNVDYVRRRSSTDGLVNADDLTVSSRWCSSLMKTTVIIPYGSESEWRQAQHQRCLQFCACVPAQRSPTFFAPIMLNHWEAWVCFSATRQSHLGVMTHKCVPYVPATP